MSQSKKPATTTKPKAQRLTDKALAEAELEKVSGGVEFHDITITKQYDKSSPKVG